MEEVHILGAGRTDFRRNARKEGKTIRDLLLEAARAALADSGVDPSRIGAGIVGNFASGCFTRQLHLGAVLTEADDRFRGIPTMRVEAACASGGAAVLAGAQAVASGLHEAVLVAGVEQQKTMSPAEGADILAAAGDYLVEKPRYGDPMFPKLFGRIAEAYRARHGLAERQLALVAVKSRAHARLNPLAQMREAPLTLEEACSESEKNPRIAPPLKITDCSQITDGAAAVVLARGPLADRPGRGKGRSSVRLLGYGHATDRVGLDAKDPPVFSTARKAAAKAYGMAGIGPGDLDGLEVHDCFSISEIVAYEILGLAEDGKGTALLESGATMVPAVRRELGLGGGRRSVPVNAGGGLMGDGHPVGATGVRQVVEIYAHLTGGAGGRQIEGARRMLAFNMGGSFTTSVATIWGRD